MLSTKLPWGVSCSSQQLGHTEHMVLVLNSLLCADWWQTFGFVRMSRFSFSSLIGVQHSLPVLDLDESVLVFAVSSVLFEGTTVHSFLFKADAWLLHFSFFISTVISLLCKPLRTSVAWRLDRHWDSIGGYQKRCLHGKAITAEHKQHCCASFTQSWWTFCLKDSTLLTFLSLKSTYNVSSDLYFAWSFSTHSVTLRIEV